MTVTLQEWEEWVLLPVTKEFFDYLTRNRERLKEEWASSIYTGPDETETLQRNAAAIGQVNLLKELLDMSYEELEGSKDE